MVNTVLYSIQLTTPSDYKNILLIISHHTLTATKTLIKEIYTQL